MKFYAILLALLWLLRMAVSLSALLFGQHPAFMLNHALDLVLLTMAMAGAIQVGFGKIWLPRLTPNHWRMVSRATLLLGALSTLLYTQGERLDIPTPAGPGLMNVVMIFMPYLLFAIPVIVLEHNLRKADQA